MLILASHWSVGLPPLLLLVGTIWPGAGWQNNYHGKSDDIAWQLVRSWPGQLVTHKKLKFQASNEKQNMWMPVKTWNQIKKSKHGGLPQLFGFLSWRWKQLFVFFYNCKHGWRIIKEMVKICLEQLFPYLDCPQIYLAQEQSHGDTETSLATRLCKFEWALNFLQTHGLWCSDPCAILCSDCTLMSANSTVENVICPS